MIQDGAKGHIAKIVTAFLDSSNILYKKNVWPGNTPNLNLIDNLWSILKESATESPTTKTRSEIIARFAKKWKSISGDLLQKLAQPFKERV